MVVLLVLLLVVVVVVEVLVLVVVLVFGCSHYIGPGWLTSASACGMLGVQVCTTTPSCHTSLSTYLRTWPCLTGEDSGQKPKLLPFLSAHLMHI